MNNKIEEQATEEADTSIGEKEPYFNEKRLYKVIGVNACRARDIAGLTRKEAQARVWRYKDPNMHPNRISELESGDKKVDLKIFYKMCIEYGCSADYLLGLSNDFERNTAASYTGMIFNSVRGSVLEATEQICMQMSQVIRYLPPFQGELLRGSAKNMLEAVEKHADLNFRCLYPELIDMAVELRNKINMFDMMLAKQMRIIELNMLDQINDTDEKASSRSMAEYDEVPLSEKC